MWWGYLTVRNSIPILANPFHDLICSMHEYILEGLENYCQEYCLDPREVSTDFQKKWQAHVHWATAGNRCTRIPTYKGNVHHGTQLVRVNNQNEIFRLIVALRVDTSPNPTISSTITTLTIFSYSVEYDGTQESRPWSFFVFPKWHRHQWWWRKE